MSLFKDLFGFDVFPDAEVPVFRTPTDRRIDLAVAVPLSDDVLRLSLTVGGKTEQFTISRGAAASLAGRIAEALK